MWISLKWITKWSPGKFVPGKFLKLGHTGKFAPAKFMNIGKCSKSKSAEVNVHEMQNFRSVAELRMFLLGEVSTSK